MTEDAVLARRLTTYSRRIEQISLTVSPSPLPEAACDAYVLPIERLEELLESTSRPTTWLPIIAYGGESGMRSAFLCGCCDYLRDPWSPEELTLRASRIVNSSVFQLPWGSVQLSTGSVKAETGEVDISIYEYRLLRVLLKQLGKAVPREVLYYAARGRYDRCSRSVDVHISTLRKKLSKLAPDEPAEELIRAARGYGYFIPSD